MITSVSSPALRRTPPRRVHDPERNVKELAYGVAGTVGALVGGTLGALPGATVGLTRIFSEEPRKGDHTATCDVGDWWTTSYALAGGLTGAFGCLALTGPGIHCIVAGVALGAAAVVPAKLFRSACQKSARVPHGDYFSSSISYCGDRAMSLKITNPLNGLVQGIKEGAKMGYYAFGDLTAPSVGASERTAW